MTKGKKDVLSIAEVAQEIGRNPVTVWRYVRAKMLTPIRPEPPYLIHRDELEAFLKKDRPPGWPKGKPRPRRPRAP